MPYPQTHRLVVVGGDRVGKTAIIEQLIFGNHVIGQNGIPTIADIYDIVVETEKGVHERLQIFDTAGSLFLKDSSGSISEQEHYLHIADGFIMVYEITSRTSYDLVTSIHRRIVSKNKEVPVILLGNKSDCNAIREVNADVAGQWARSRGIRPYEVTVINRDSLKDPFCYIAWRMANPGRGLSSLPLLTSTTGSSSKPHPFTDPSAEETDQARVKLEESQREGSTHSLPATRKAHGQTNPPKDAMFPPKHSAATLFLGDCLNAKSKQHWHSDPNLDK